LFLAPTNVLLYALADSGYVGFYDPTAINNGDLYFVARSLRPVAVAYDPVRKVIRQSFYGLSYAVLFSLHLSVCLSRSGI